MNSVPPVSVCPQSLLRLVGLIAPGWARELDFQVRRAERQGDSNPRPTNNDTCESVRWSGRRRRPWEQQGHGEQGSGHLSELQTFWAEGHFQSLYFSYDSPGMGPTFS